MSPPASGAHSAGGLAPGRLLDHRFRHAALADVATPLAQAFLAIGSAICSEDFAVTGRTLASMGLGHLDAPILQQLLRVGFA